MSRSPICLAALAVFLSFLGAATAQKSDNAERLDRATAASLLEITRTLSREIEYLQEDIIFELNGGKDPTLYRQADALLAEVAKFQDTVKPDESLLKLAEQFDALDEKLHQLVEQISELGDKHRILRRAARRVRAVDEQLHFAIYEHAALETHKKQILDRQAHALNAAALQLNETASYALGARGAVLVSELKKFTDATARFDKTASLGAKREQLRKDFTAVNQAWERALHNLQKLKPEESILLLRYAGRVDRLHERLFRLLDMSGKRPQLIIGT